MWQVVVAATKLDLLLEEEEGEEEAEAKTGEERKLPPHGPADKVIFEFRTGKQANGSIRATGIFIIDWEMVMGILGDHVLHMWRIK